MKLINEYRYLFSQPLIWAGIVIPPIFVFILTYGIPGNHLIVEKQLLFLGMTSVMMTLPLLIGPLFSHSMLRDKSHQMWELIATTAVPYRQQVLTRWLAMLILVISISVVCQLVILWSLSNAHQQPLMDIMPYSGKIILITILPSAFFLSALACFLSVRFNSSTGVYISFALLWMGYLFLSSMTGSPILAGSTVVSETLLTLMQWLDPYAITSVMQQLDDSVTGLFTSQYVIFNRLGYLVLGVLLLLKAKTSNHSAKATKRASNELNTKSSTVTNRYIPAVANLETRRVFKHQVQFICKRLISHKSILSLLAIWLVLLFSEVSAGMHYAEPFSAVLPTSLDAVNRIAWDIFLVMGITLVITASWLTCWYDKRRSMSELTAATPIANPLIILSQVTSLISLILLYALVTFIALSLTELAFGSDWQPLISLQILAMQSVPLILFAATTIAIHHTVKSQATAALIIATILVIKFTPLTSKLGITHVLWRFFDAPVIKPDSFWWFDASENTLLPFMVFWLPVVSSLLFISVAISHRGTTFAQYTKLRSPSIILILLCLSSGLYLDNRLRTESPRMHAEHRAEWRADYEKQYSDWRNVPQPVVSNVVSKVAIFPERETADIALTLTLSNNSTQPIENVLIGGYWKNHIQHIALESGSVSQFDSKLNQYLFQLQQPMQVGEKLALRVTLHLKQDTVWPARMHQIIKQKFSYIRAVPILPYVGFNPQLTLKSAAQREQYQLPELSVIPPSVQFANRTSASRYDRVDMHTTISTSSGQTAIAQGALVKQWQQGNRAYFEYRTQQPIRNIPTWISVPGEITTKTDGSTTLNVFTPEKSDAASLHVKAMSDTIRWFEQNIAPYPGQQLNLIAAPSIGSSGYALPQIMLINYKLGFRAFPDEQAGFDQRYRRTVHETAHQWFGHTIGYGEDQDRAFLIESMAKYVELVMLDTHYGEQSAKALVDYESNRFRIEQIRNSKHVLPLIDAQQSFDQYSRASLVWGVLRREVGDPAIISAIKQLFIQGKQSPVTSMDFVRHLRAQVDADQRPLIDELLLGADLSALD